MKNNNKKGFTLVELVIVVAVMAILVAVAIPTVSSITGSAKESVQETNCRTIESVIKLKEAELSKGADGIATIQASDIYTAVNAAKLGITKDTYYYFSSKGIVSHASNAIADETPITIGFDASGTASGSAYSAG